MLDEYRLLEFISIKHVGKVKCGVEDTEREEERSWAPADVAEDTRDFEIVARGAMNNERIFKMAFSSVYPHYVKKVERKDKTVTESLTIIYRLTGYDDSALQEVIERRIDLRTFFEQAPRMHPNVSKITGMIRRCRIEEIEDPLMRQVRYLDKLVDELASGRKATAAPAEAHSIRMSNHLWPEVSAQVLSTSLMAHWLEYSDWWNPILAEPLAVGRGLALAADGPGSGIAWNERVVGEYLA